MFDTALDQQRRTRATDDFLQHTMARLAAERLNDLVRNFESVAVVGPQPISFVSHPKCQRLEHVRTYGERLNLGGERYDAVISLGHLHRVADVPGVLIQAAQGLRPDGLFLGVLLGGQTLAELREVMMEAEIECRAGASVRVHPAIDIRDGGALLQRAGFAMPVADSTTLTASYTTATHLMQDLRACGETNVLEQRSHRPLTRGVLERINALYAERYSDAEGRITARFEIIIMTGWNIHHGAGEGNRTLA